MTPVNARERQLSALDILELRHLPEEGLAFDEALPVAWLAGAIEGQARGLTFTVTEPGRVVMEVTPMGPIDQRPPLRLRGRVEAVVSTDCVRCLEAVRPRIDAEFDLTLLPATETESATAGKRGGHRKLNEDDARLEDWSGEDFPDPDVLADATYPGDRVDLPEFVREALLLGLTTHPICADTEGCDVRTAALIEEANRPVRAAEGDLDPRWAALRGLRVTDDEPS